MNIYGDSWASKMGMVYCYVDATTRKTDMVNLCRKYETQIEIPPHCECKNESLLYV